MDSKRLIKQKTLESLHKSGLVQNHPNIGEGSRNVVKHWVNFLLGKGKNKKGKILLQSRSQMHLQHQLHSNANLNSQLPQKPDHAYEKD